MPVIKKKTKVKDIAKKYGITSSAVLTELKGLGLSLTSPTDFVDIDVIDIVEEHFVTLEKNEKAKVAKAKSAGPVHETAPPAAPTPPAAAAGNKEIFLKPPIVVRVLSEAIQRKPNELVSKLLSMNVIAGINQTIDPDVAKKLCEGFGFELVVEKREKEHSKTAEGDLDESIAEDPKILDNPENLMERPPVVTFLGHVDHGKTSLQDYIRKTSVVTRESGGITQHIGASMASIRGKSITFIDTPGHEAFTAMRARGANVTDIAILVVAADDGFMPQTIEALNHVKAAKVPIIVAINKMDLPTADPEKVVRQMQQHGLSSEEWGGETGTVRVSATTGKGVNELLERILLESEMLQLKADPNRPAEGVILEAQLEQGYGPTASALVRSGTLKEGDPIICGQFYGKVKNIIDCTGKKIKSAGPSQAVKIVGISGVPEAGVKFTVCSSEKETRKLADERSQAKRLSGLEFTEK